MVYCYEPSDVACGCKRNCHKHFDDANDSAIKEAREPLYDQHMNRGVFRGQLLHNWREHLKLPDGKPCCATMCCRIFACSRTLLWPDQRIQQSREEANRDSPIAIAVIAWFYELRKTLDIMPDGDWYMVNQPKKKLLFENYKLDVKTWPTIHIACCPSYFNAVWAEHFPDIRLRKHCRFTKCTFCVYHRTIIESMKSSSLAYTVAKEAMRRHYRWAHQRERGLYMEKRSQAKLNPAKFLSIAIDGTDKFPNGFPHFKETTKGTDGERLNLHVICVMVHGLPPRVYLGWESLKSDPNLVCEVLTRTLLTEQERRGTLPDTLYLQTDNCIRENKNTYLGTYLEWLAERKVFKHIFGSFLPVGHTHFDCDQLASRISECIKHRDITSIEQLVELITYCYKPAPIVEFIDDVLDWRNLLNPTVHTDSQKARNFPLDTSRTRRLMGIATKRLHEQFREYMLAASDLHWQIRLNSDGHAFLQTKATVDHKEKGLVRTHILME